MKTTYNKSRIMKNAWVLKRFNKTMSFAACLRKAWFNEKMNVARAKVEGRVETNEVKNYEPARSASFVAGCLDYYASARNGQYLGD